MASRVGTGVSGSLNTASNTVASAAKSTTTGNTLTVYIKWELIGQPNVTSVADTAGNTFTERTEITHGSGEPSGVWYYAENITGNASNVVTVTFGSASTTFKRVLVEEWSGLATSSSLDGSQQSNTGTGTAFSTPDITTTTSGLVVLGVSGFTALSSWSGTPGVPDFSVGITESDCAILYLISGSAQTVSPAASATGSDVWVSISQAFKDASGAGPGSGSDSSVVGMSESSSNLIRVSIIEETS